MFIDDITKLTTEQKVKLLKQIKYDKLYSKIKFFKPYPWQQDFYSASKQHKQRYLRAGNRVGKSFSEAYEFAYHITGQYPSWWDGAVIEGAGHSFWAVGYDNTSTANVLQKELFGTNDAGLKEELGTGSIPKDCIDFDSMRKDGKRIIQCRIKHKDGWNTLMFYAQHAGPGGMMGQSIKYAWMDEEHEHRSTEIYNQLVMRTVEAEGFVVFTSTPEAGFTELNRRFEEKEGLYLKQVGWDMVEHLTEEMKQEVLSGVAEYKHDCVMKGLPVIGSGAVFPYDDSDIIIDDFDIPLDWEICAGIDIGHTSDSSTCVYAAIDPEGCVYLIGEWEGKNAQDPNLGKPAAMAHWIKNSLYSTIPVIAPHDAGSKSGSPEAYASKLRELDINVQFDPFHNPYDSNVGMDAKVRHNNPETGLVLMRQLMDEGKFKVFRSCRVWIEEKRSYFYKPNGDRSKPDHMMDSSRLAAVSLLANRGKPAVQCQGAEEFTYEYVNIGDAVSRNEAGQNMWL